MRRVTASLALFVVMLAVFAPMARATVLRNADACSFKKQHRGTAISHRESSGASQHARCSPATLQATPAAPATLGARPLPSHPFVTEFYPDAESTDAAPRQANRAPPASDRSER
ncbi:MAG: hypothetical protein HYX28_05355 [Candidatus Koribacter versatilis]|uniref:Uncharacterized protein n=1 Tax=Candidatus Korobacter versatilis TaxID=658062 RepID=A0A932A823_9BACT|nr:hypothetical protein [Candidatus Koribacter versatilis]